MRAQLPTAQAAAGHVPADLVPEGTDPRTVVIVQQAPRSYTGPVVVTVVASLGAALVVWLLVVLVHATADAADEIATAAASAGGVGIGGITLKIARKAGK